MVSGGGGEGKDGTGRPGVARGPRAVSNRALLPLSPPAMARRRRSAQPAGGRCQNGHRQLLWVHPQRGCCPVQVRPGCVRGTRAAHPPGAGAGGAAGPATKMAPDSSAGGGSRRRLPRGPSAEGLRRGPVHGSLGLGPPAPKVRAGPWIGSLRRFTGVQAPGIGLDWIGATKICGLKGHGGRDSSPTPRLAGCV